MLADEDQSKRELAVKHIRRARENYRPVIREVNKPKRGEMNFNASQYCDMIDLDATEVTEPPCTFQLTDDELESIVTGETKFRLPKVYCHTQSCERAVSQTTLASQKVVSNFYPILNLIGLKIHPPILKLIPSLTSSVQKLIRS